MNLVNDLNSLEEKLLDKMAKGNKMIHMLASDENNSLVYVGDKRIDPRILLLCHMTPNSKTINGKISKNNFAYSYESGLEVLSKELRIFIDRSKEKICIYGSNNGTPFSRKEGEEEDENDLIIAYIEHQSFAQLMIFNSHLKNNISEIVIRKDHLFKELRNNAFTLVSTIIPNFKEILIDNKFFERK